ncbi:GntR family transcriptional regulator [Cryobacterium algoritolerans]|uniref:GntR family transcriptional regulator n=1 Tax=Cryobacterium algoritolerans TaxID=1259184 RepID=A0A4R8WXZ1_9MICO|nr:GntR family transcriptional regulator [Cryobacterium algoritolerans]TFC15655.1 GntR family transcriptional regulator [Cryobacterium algoritolerans]
MQTVTDEVEKRTPAGIATALGRLISSGRLAPGDRLPTVRALAAALAVSPATVSHAWQALSAVGLIVSRGSSGTFVLEAAPRGLPVRSQSMAGYHRGACPGARLTRCSCPISGRRSPWSPSGPPPWCTRSCR